MNGWDVIKRQKPRLKWSAMYQHWYTPSGAGPPTLEERVAWPIVIALNKLNKEKRQ